MQCVDKETLSFRGDAKHRTRNLEIPGLVLSDHPGMTKHMHHPCTPRFRSTKHAWPALRIRLQSSSAAGRVSVPIRTW